MMKGLLTEPGKWWPGGNWLRRFWKRERAAARRELCADWEYERRAEKLGDYDWEDDNVHWPARDE